MSERIFGILDLDGSDIALDACHLLEVTALPKTLAPRPLAPAWSLGSFALRGALIPTVDLARLLALDHDDAPRPTGDHVAIVGFRGGRFGLRVHNVRDVVTIEDHQLQTLGASRNTPDTLTPRVFIHPDEQRPIHVLELEALFRLDGMMLTFDDAACEGPTAEEVAAVELPPDRHRALIVEHGTLRLAIDAAVVREVAEYGPLSAPVTRVSGYLGNQILRQNTIPVFDPAILLGHRSASPVAQRIVILEGPRGLIALGITRIERMVDYSDAACRPLAGDEAEADCIRGLLSSPGLDDALLIDHKALLEEATLSGLADIHASLSLTSGKVSEERQWQRFAFISYTAGGQYVTPLNQIDAVLPLPEKITPLSGDGPFTGTFRRLERTVSLIDLRQLLGRSTEAAPGQVLVVNHGDSAIGFMIDEVRLIDYIDAPADSLVIRWRGDRRADASALESSKRLIAIGEKERLRILTVLCLENLASRLSRDMSLSCDLDALARV
ncbi:chemotaxis protein CheW [Kushneria phosphatilytica]|uniref:Uncharacterized protein n=1 Tax=Kushneria phosphatilytica TaxID=657387 RepID=A0A1S1P1B7_9GAMM|nr:chemotaxis protein CheW [Kushneria phosphatilytica]OHV13847.1 hypothetical protein BH688_00355 [Kushneria phosphatilytica]QEL10400.1 hypothetical protein FY550_04095 [Kushneria phosphatilytica]